MKTKKLEIKISPQEFYYHIHNEYENSFLFESVEGEQKTARFSFIGFDPTKMIKAHKNIVTIENDEKEVTDPIKVLKENIGIDKENNEGFIGGGVGYFSYDYARSIEKIPDKHEKSEFPDFEFGIFDDTIVYDHRKGIVNYIYKEVDRKEEVLRLLKDEKEKSKFSTSGIINNTDKKEYSENVKKAKEFIKSGDIFQVVLSRKYEGTYKGNLLNFYEKLKITNPSPYMYYISFGKRKIIGSSPENLVRVEGNNVETYATLAGTRKRGKTPKEDKKLEMELRKDEKEKAEHLMLVDLTRNDVGKVAEFGSVKVKRLMDVVKFSHVQHLYSHITAKLGEGKNCYDAFNALFPAGTLTGAPKIRAMELIEKLEKVRRGPYGGAVGYFSANGNCDFAISIRTLFANQNKFYVQAGAGIVYDSIPEKEFEETENKAKTVLDALKFGGLI